MIKLKDMHYVKGHTTFTSDNIYSSYLIKLVVATVCGDNYSFKCHSDRTHNYVYDDFEFNSGISPEKSKKCFGIMLQQIYSYYLDHSNASGYILVSTLCKSLVDVSQ